MFNKFSDMATIALFLVGQHYLSQKNMIIQTIKQMMISRQQTQMRSYFETSDDPVLVVSQPNESTRDRSVQLLNSAAKNKLGLMQQTAVTSRSPKKADHSIDLNSEIFSVVNRNLNDTS